jgi:hypothetical protein
MVWLKEAGTEDNLWHDLRRQPGTRSVNLSQAPIRAEGLALNLMQEFFHVIRTQFSVRV